ncbi:cytokine receptor family member B12 isoform X2 [Puntigrus tetrazona]|uniref:cytokine receptor family member B12 isoform X2 n=1 Tax=Puntigrus tetrazona TaxID=1606681 RepID=UPI001C89F5BB|nr:cytokine receptor family member B12 isoform X2 [Puntigrus tetrazona]
MTHFLACTLTVLQICLTPAKAILSPPRNLTVGLLDFKATAEWLPPEGNPPETRYTLEFIAAQKMSGGKWNGAPQCSNTAVPKCELTFDGQPNELHWNYFVRVKATFKGMSSNWTTASKTFQPYGDTRLSPPNVKVSTEQKSIKINFSHWLELKPEVKPLEYLLYLFESSPAGELKFLALRSTSESPYVFHGVPSGKNYCVSVSASHQKASKSSNFNTTNCVFLLDSTRSFVLVVCIAAMLLIIFSTGFFLSFGWLYHMRLQIKNLRIPKPLIDIAIYKMVLKPTSEVSQPITVTTPKKEMHAERSFASSEEDCKDDPKYHSREILASIASANPPEPDEEAEASNQYDKYTLANELEDSEENEIYETDDDCVHPGSESESGSICANTSHNSRSSEILQMVHVNMYLKSEMDSNYAEETLSCSSGSDYKREVLAGEEEDSFFLPGSNSESGYEPRQSIMNFCESTEGL